MEPQVRQSQVVDLMEALKASLDKHDGAAKAPRAAGRARKAPAAAAEVTFEEFQAEVNGAGLAVGAAELKKSYNGLTSLGKRKRLDPAGIRGKVVNLRKDLEVIRSDPELFGNAPKKLKAARIPSPPGTGNATSSSGPVRRDEQRHGTGRHGQGAPGDGRGPALVGRVRYRAPARGPGAHRPPSGHPAHTRAGRPSGRPARGAGRRRLRGHPQPQRPSHAAALHPGARDRPHPRGLARRRVHELRRRRHRKTSATA